MPAAPPIEALGSDPRLAVVIGFLRESEESLRVGVGEYVRARVRDRSHSLQRRHASAVQQALFAVAEVFDRVAAEARRATRHQ